jgi:hypothetical protein
MCRKLAPRASFEERAYRIAFHLGLGAARRDGLECPGVASAAAEKPNRGWLNVDNVFATAEHKTPGVRRQEISQRYHHY